MHPSLPRRSIEALQRLGPTFIKLGQAISLRPDLLPAPWIAALRELREHAEQVPIEAIREEIERGLGRPVEAVFASFDPVPIAAASVAQVHGARLPDGREVIVKVRRPGVRHHIGRDIRALIPLARIGARLNRQLATLDPVGLLRELETDLLQETDLRIEARNIRRFADAFRGSATVFIPEVPDNLISESVVVQVMSPGHHIEHLAPGDDGKRLAGALVEAYLHQFFALGWFHADPHPGNLFALPDGRLCLHDFGLVGRLDPPVRRALAAFVQAFAHQDAAWFQDAAKELGLLGGIADPAAFRHGLREILSDYGGRPLREWSVADAFLRIMRLGGVGTVRVPRELLALRRALYLLEGTLRILDPEFEVIGALLAKGETTLRAVMLGDIPSGSPPRLKFEAAMLALDAPAALGAWLHRLGRDGPGIPIDLRHTGIDHLSRQIERAGYRLANALVALGLFIAGALLQQHSLGPFLFDGLPLFSAAGYAMGFWFTLRLARDLRRRDK